MTAAPCILDRIGKQVEQYLIKTEAVRQNVIGHSTAGADLEALLPCPHLHSHDLGNAHEQG